MQFNISEKNRIEDYAEQEHVNLMDTIEDKYTQLFREHPTRENFGDKTMIRELLDDKDLMKYLN